MIDLDYRRILIGTDPNRPPEALTAYIRTEFREANYPWFLLAVARKVKVRPEAPRSRSPAPADRGPHPHPVPVGMRSHHHAGGPHATVECCEAQELRSL